MLIDWGLVRLKEEHIPFRVMNEVENMLFNEFREVWTFRLLLISVTLSQVSQCWYELMHVANRSSPKVVHSNQKWISFQEAYERHWCQLSICKLDNVSWPVDLTTISSLIPITWEELTRFETARDASSAAKEPPQPQSRDLLQLMLDWKQSILFGIVIRTKSVSAFQYWTLPESPILKTRGTKLRRQSCPSQMAASEGQVHCLTGQHVCSEW